MNIVRGMRCGHARPAVRLAVAVACILSTCAAPVAARTRLKTHGTRSPGPIACLPQRCYTGSPPPVRLLDTRFAAATSSPTGADCQPFFATDTGLTNGTVRITFTPDTANPGRFIMSSDRGLLLPPASTTPNDCGFNDIRQFITFDGVENTQYDVQNIRLSNDGVFTFNLTYGANGVLFNQQSACLDAVGYPAPGFLGVSTFSRQTLRNFAERYLDLVFIRPPNAMAPIHQGDSLNLLVGTQLFTSEAPGEFFPSQTLTTPPNNVPVSVVVGRFNNDALEDVAYVTADAGTSQTSLFIGLQDANGNFSTSTVDAGSNISDVAAGQGGEGEPWVLYVVDDEGIQSVRFADGGTIVIRNAAPLPPLLWTGTADLTGDQRDELIAVNLRDSNQLVVNVVNFAGGGNVELDGIAAIGVSTLKQLVSYIPVEFGEP